MIRPITLLIILVAVVVLASRTSGAQDEPRSPAQPATGPGGADYKHRQVVANLYGTGPTRYWIFEPADPLPDRTPLVVFNHGWSAMEPKVYGAWIDHIVRRGNIVIYPVYQDSLRTPTRNFTPNAATGIRRAIQRLQSDSGHVKPDLDKVAVVGHSMGGVIAANLAARWQAAGVPQPKAVMCVQPGKTWTMSERTAVKLEDLSLVNKNTLLLAVAGDRDRLAKDVDAKRIFKGSTQVLPQNKNYIVLVSDDHGQPALSASHFAPCAPNLKYTDPSTSSSDSGSPSSGGRLRERLRERMQGRQSENSDEPDYTTETARAIDALDFYGTWKLFDGLCDAAFYGTNREYALGNTPQQRFMGKWSDGTPVKELQVTVAP
jgi:pimeloyl-ACP methyl ester carboxylesterase